MKRTFGGRNFQLWEYGVSHGQALVRSPRRGTTKTNQDVILVGVEYLGLPRHLRALELDDPSDAEVRLAGTLLGKVVPPEHVWVFVGDGRRHLAVAAKLIVEESDMDIFESPFELEK